MGYVTTNDGVEIFIRTGDHVMRKYYFSIMVGHSVPMIGMHNYYIFLKKDIGL